MPASPSGVHQQPPTHLASLRQLQHSTCAPLQRCQHLNRAHSYESAVPRYVSDREMHMQLFCLPAAGALLAAIPVSHTPPSEIIKLPPGALKGLKEGKADDMLAVSGCL